jgi:hypothetical protein
MGVMVRIAPLEFLGPAAELAEAIIRKQMITAIMTTGLVVII